MSGGDPAMLGMIRGLAQRASASVKAQLSRIAAPSDVPVAPARDTGTTGEAMPDGVVKHAVPAMAEVEEIAELLGTYGIALAGADIADIGSGDGTFARALMRSGAGSCIGFDEESARTGADLDGAIESLGFRSINEGSLPAGDEQFDVAIMMGSVGRLSRLPRLADEIRRVLRPSGMLFIASGPLFHSAAGADLPPAVGAFSHLAHQQPVIESRTRRAVANDAATDDVLRRFALLNRVTIDELQQVLLGAGFAITWARLEAPAVELPREIQHRPLSELLPAAITLIARPARAR